MERLTRRELWWGSQGKTDKAINYKVDEERRCVTHEGSPDFLIADKLAEYEDLEEQGKLLRLPCEIGQKVYMIYQFCGEGAWEIEEHKIKLEDLENIGKTVFFTRKEAERALAEMEGKNGN